MGKGEDAGLCLLGCRTLLYQVEQLREHSEAALAMEPEGIHQMRVASRRLRAGLPIFSSCLKESQYRIWRKEVKGLTGALGEARDTDVQMEYLRSLLSSVREDQRAGVQVLLDTKVGLRQDQQGQVRGWLANLEEQGLLMEMAEHLSRSVRRLEAKKPELRGRAAYAAGLAFVTNRVTALLKLEGAVPDPLDREGHHRMRIAAKRLRYTLEAFHPLFDDNLDREIETLKGVQDVLGEMHDCDVWLATVNDLDQGLCPEGQIDQAAVKAGLEAVRADRGREREVLYAKFVPRWSELREERYFERLPERFQSALTCREINIPVLDHGRVKLAVISDVHGNMDALRAVLDDAKDQGVSGLLNLGDMVGTGPHPDEVVKALSGDRVLSVIGNFDLKVLEFSRVSRKPKPRSVKGAIVAAAARDLTSESLDLHRRSAAGDQTGGQRPPHPDGPRQSGRPRRAPRSGDPGRKVAEAGSHGRRGYRDDRPLPPAVLPSGRGDDVLEPRQCGSANRLGPPGLLCRPRHRRHEGGAAPGGVRL